MNKRIYDDQYDEGDKKRGLLWYLFCMPGAVLMWTEYMFPGRGQVYATSRRHNNRIVQFLYTISIYGALIIMAALGWGSFINSPKVSKPVPKVSTTKAASQGAIDSDISNGKTQESGLAIGPGQQSPANVSRGPADYSPQLSAPLERKPDETAQVAAEKTTPANNAELTSAVTTALQAGGVARWRGGDLTAEVSVSAPQAYGDRECRSYRYTVRQGSNVQTTDDMACRLKDGDWDLSLRPPGF